MDEKQFEHAAEIELAMRENALLASKKYEARSHIRPEGFDGSCPECADQIPEARVAAGYYVCIKCKEEQEFVEKQYARPA